MENVIAKTLATNPVPAKPIAKADKPIAKGAETPASLSNSNVDINAPESELMSFEELKAFAKKMGTVAGKADAALPSLAMEVTIMARKNLIDEVENKHKCAHSNRKDGMTDDAGLLYDEYYKAHGKVQEAFSQGSWKANASKLRNFVQVGRLPKINAVKVMTDARNAYIALNGGTGSKDKNKDSKTLYPFYIEVAQKQLAQPEKQLTREELDVIVKKQKAATKELLDKLKTIAKSLESLTKEKKDGTIEDDHAKTKQALKVLYDRIQEIVLLNEAKSKGLKVK